MHGSVDDPNDRWELIGLYDEVMRRALWMRINLGKEHLYESIELRSGREGDDGYILFDRTFPQFDELINVLTRANTFKIAENGDMIGEYGECLGHLPTKEQTK